MLLCVLFSVHPAPVHGSSTMPSTGILPYFPPSLMDFYTPPHTHTSNLHEVGKTFLLLTSFIDEE